MNCQTFEEHYLEEIDGLLSPELSSQIQAHIRSCVTCRERYEAAQESLLLTRQYLVQHTPSLALDQAILKGAEDHLKRLQEESKPSKGWMHWLGQRLEQPSFQSALAFSTVLVLVGSVYLYRFASQKEWIAGFKKQASGVDQLKDMPATPAPQKNKRKRLQQAKPTPNIHADTKNNEQASGAGGPSSTGRFTRRRITDTENPSKKNTKQPTKSPPIYKGQEPKFAAGKARKTRRTRRRIRNRYKAKRKQRVFRRLAARPAFPYRNKVLSKKRRSRTRTLHAARRPKIQHKRIQPLARNTQTITRQAKQPATLKPWQAAARLPQNKPVSKNAFKRKRRRGAGAQGRSARSGALGLAVGYGQVGKGSIRSTRSYGRRAKVRPSNKRFASPPPPPTAPLHDTSNDRSNSWTGNPSLKRRKVARSKTLKKKRPHDDLSRLRFKETSSSSIQHRRGRLAGGSPSPSVAAAPIISQTRSVRRQYKRKSLVTKDYKKAQRSSIRIRIRTYLKQLKTASRSRKVYIYRQIAINYLNLGSMPQARHYFQMYIGSLPSTIRWRAAQDILRIYQRKRLSIQADTLRRIWKRRYH